MKFLKPLDKVLKIYKFKDKPIIVGGGDREYYGLRKKGHDLEMIISKRDKDAILKLKKYPLNLFGGKTEKDIDATFTNFAKTGVDLIISLDQIKYDYWKKQAKPFKGQKDLLIISLKDLLKSKKLAVKYAPKQLKHKRDV